VKPCIYDRGVKVKAERALEGFGEDERGVFETLRAYQGRIFRLDEHLKRLRESAKSVGLELPRPISTMKKELELSLADWLRRNPAPKPEENLSLRMAVWNQNALVWVGVRKSISGIFPQGMVLRTTALRRPSTHASAPESKTNACQNAVLAYFDPEPKPDERLFLDAEGFAAEASVGNIFLVKKKCLLTPPARGILNGVTRLFVLECARLAGIEALETPLTRHDLYNADEVFLTNTSWEILPVRDLDGRSIGNTVPGPMTRKLHRLFKRRIHSECRKPLSAAH